MMVMCKCKACRRALRTKWGGAYAQGRRRAHRHEVKRLLHMGEQYDIPDRFSLGYIG